MTHEFIPRTDTAESIDKVMEDVIESTLLDAANYLADRQGVSLSDLATVTRPLSAQANRPSDVGDIHYSFSVSVEEADGATINDEAFELEYRLNKSESTITTFDQLSDQERAGIVDRLKEIGEYDDEVIDLLEDEGQKEMWDDFKCEIEAVTHYDCHQSTLISVKNIGVNYFFDGECIMTVGVESGAVGPVSESLDSDDVTLIEVGMDMQMLEPEDVVTLQEILYYLQLPGGQIQEDMTNYYISGLNS